MLVLKNPHDPNGLVKSASITWKPDVAVYELCVTTKYGTISGYYESSMAARCYFGKRYFKGGIWEKVEGK